VNALEGQLHQKSTRRPKRLPATKNAVLKEKLIGIVSLAGVDAPEGNRLLFHLIQQRSRHEDFS
jgi:hypothetical protein